MERKRYSDELHHYGVKGMKWGVRKDVYKSIGNISKSASNVVRKTNNKKKNYSNLSNEELRRRIDRLQLEKRYSELTGDDMSKGKRRAMQILDISGDVASVAASAAAIGLTLHRIKKG